MSKGNHSFSRGATGTICLFYEVCVAPSVACRLSGSLISEKGDTVLLEDSSLWDLANVVGGPWGRPKAHLWLYMCVTEEALVLGLDRYTS